MKKTTLRQAAMKLALVALVLLSPLGLRAQQSLPYSYGFENNDLSADGWTTQNPSGLNASEFGIKSSAKKTGSYGFRFSSYNDNGTNTQYLISPELSAAGGVVVQFYYKGSSSSGDEVFKVGYSTTGTNISDFTFGSEIATDGNTSWTLSDEFTFPAGTKYVAIYYYANYQYRLYVDDFTFNAPASCPKPTGLTCTATTGTPATATFSWTNGGEETDWVLEYSIASDFTDATPINISTTDLNTDGSYTITTGLTAETRYYAHLKADCGGGDESIWSDAIDFKPTNAISQTVCDGTTTNNYIPVYGSWADAYNKSEFIIPATTEGMANMVNGTISSMTFYLSSPAADSWGNALFRVFLKEVDESSFASTSYYGTNDATIVYDGALDGTQSTMTVEFTTDYEYQGGNLLVGIYQYQKGTYKGCAFYGISSTNASLYKYNSSSFDGITTGTSQNFIPKTTFVYLPSNTPKPKNVHYDDLSSTAVTVIWETPNITPDSYEYQYKESTTSDWPTSWTTNSTNLSVTLSLSASTTYDFRVRAVYSEGESDPVEIQFTTLPSCPAPTATLTDGSVNAHGATIQWNDMGSTGYNVRYQVSNSITVDFESGSLPDGWTANTSSTSSGVQSNQGRNNSYGFQFYYSENGATLVSPVLSGTENGVSFSFYYKRYSDDYTEGFKVGYNTDGSDVFTYGDEISVTNTSSWLQYENTFPAGTKRIAIKYVYNNAWYLFIDDINIVIPNDNWTTVNDITNTNYPITGLTAETRYLVQVQSVCGEDVSSWSESVSFTTDVACVAPTYLAKVGDEEARQVALTWNENGANTNWQICLNVDEENPITVTGATHDDEWHVSYTLTGLNPDQEYTVKVRSNCGDEGFSQWSNAITIHTTPSCYKPTAAQVDEYDQTTATISWTRDNRNDAGETYSIWMVPGGDDDPYVLNSTTTPAVTVDNDNHTASLTGLTQHTEYVFWVGTTCANTDESVEVVPVNFTTLADCPIPVLEASGITDVTAHTANVAWTGNDQNNSYTVSYRTAAYFNGITEEFGSSLPTGWTKCAGLVDAVIAGSATVNESTSSPVWRITSYAFGNYNASLNIYGSSCNRWLVTPEITLANGSALNFDLALTDYGNSNVIEDNTAQADDRFAVLIYANDAWTILREWNNSGSPYVYNNIPANGENVQIDLSSYSGTVKIAFYGESTVGNNGDNDIHIDNVAIGVQVAAGSWQTVSPNPTAASAQLTGLTADTPYEVKVKGNCENNNESEESAVRTFRTTIACPAPVLADVDPTTITTTTATLTWTGSAASNFTVAYKAAGETDFTEIEDVTGSPFTFAANTLIPATVYTVRVKAVCGQNGSFNDGESEWSNEKTFTTDCEAVAAQDWSQNFDQVSTGSLPICWNRINEGTSTTYNSYPRVNGSNSYSPSNCLYFYTYGSSSTTTIDDQYAVLPEMTGLAGMRVTLQAKGYSTSSSFKVGTMSDPTDASTFTEIENTNNPAVITSYQPFTFDVPTNVTDRYVAIMMPKPTSTSSSTYGVYIDDISIAPIPSCDVPSFTVTEWDAHAGKLQITAGASNEEYWDLYFSESDVAPTNETTPSVSNTNNPQPWIGEDALTPATTYYVWVRAHCNETDRSAWIGPESFTTDCEAITITDVYSYEQNFNSPVVTSAYNSNTNLVTPVCWENPYTTGSNQAGKPHIIAANGSYNYSTDQVLNFYGSGNNYITLPAFTNALSDLQISFKWATETNSSDKKLTLGYITAADDGNYSSFTQIVDPFITSSTSSESYCSLKSETVYLNNVPAEATRLVFRWYSSNQYSCNVDDVVVSLAPSCFPVGTLAPATDITSTTAELSWTLVDDNQTEWEVGYKTDAEENYANFVTATTNTNYLLSGLSNALLQPSTHYTVKVRAHCGGDDYGDWSNEISFTTLDACPVPTNVNATNITNNSATITWNNNNDATVKYRTAAVPTSNVLFSENFDSYANEAALEAVWTVTDLGDGNNTDELGLSTVSDNQVFRFSSYNGSSSGSFDQYLVSPELTTIGVLEFTYKASSGSAESFRVGYSTTTNDLSEFTWGDVTNGTTTLQTYSEAMPEGAKYFAINYTAVYKHRLYIDDIAIYETAPAGEWQTATSADLSGLTANTKYDVKVVPNCDETHESATVQFTTKAAFPMHIDANMWYAIASPVHYGGNNQPLTAINNIDNAAYDLYGYNEANGTWVKEQTSLTRGKGYIYRSAVATDLEFVGDYNTGNVTASNISVSNPDADLRGFALVGNPYNHPIYKGVAFGTSSYYVTGWYSLQPNGCWYTRTNNDAIAAGEAALVKVSSSYSVSLSFTDNANAPTSSKAAPAATLAFMVSNGDYKDIAYAMLSYGEGLPKVGHLSPEAPALSIPVAGKKYAIAMVGDDAESFDLVFRGTGTYTLSFNGNTGYCHLIDRVAGKDIDMLRQNYTFSSNGFDVDRFTVKLTPDAQENANGNFAYWNGNAWVVEGEGTLQVFDALGRQLFNSELRNSNFELQNSIFPGTGVYVLRMGEKSQKIVVR